MSCRGRGYPTDPRRKVPREVQLARAAVVMANIYYMADTDRLDPRYSVDYNPVDVFDNDSGLTVSVEAVLELLLVHLRKERHRGK